MNIKELLGDAYHEGMTVEEINTALEGKNLVDPSGLPKTVSKELFDKKVSELSKLKKDYETLKSAALTDEERQQEILDAAENARKDYLKKSARLDVEKIFVEGGLTPDDYKNIVDDIVSDDTEKSINLAKAIVSLISSQKAAVEKAVKSELLKGSPKPPAGGGKVMSKEDIMKIKDSVKRQSAIAENIDLFKKGV